MCDNPERGKTIRPNTADIRRFPWRVRSRDDYWIDQPGALAPINAAYFMCGMYVVVEDAKMHSRQVDNHIFMKRDSPWFCE